MSRELPPRSMSVTRQIILLGAVLNVSYLATCIHKSSRVYLFQQAQCLNYYQANDPTKINSHYQVDEALCKIHEVQSPLSILDGVDSFLQNLPGKATPSFTVFHSDLSICSNAFSTAPIFPREKRGGQRAHMLTCITSLDRSTRTCNI